MLELASIQASIPSPPVEWSRFQLGPLTIHVYALCLLTGGLIGGWLAYRRWKKKGGPEDPFFSIIMWAVIFGIIGARLYHVVSSPDAYFGPNYDGTGDLTKIWQIWNGGLGIWGAVALGAVGAWIGCRRAGLRLSAFADAAAPGVLLAQAIGRWGNYFNQELYGGPTTLPWGLEIDPTNASFPAGLPADTLFHPTFLYEFFWNLAGVALILLLDRKFKFQRGAMFWLYVAVYTAGRTWIEMLRIDEAQMITILGITQRLNVWTSLLMFLISVVLFAIMATRPRRTGLDIVYLPGKAPEETTEITEAEAPAVAASSSSHRETPAESGETQTKLEGNPTEKS
ncbi:prolipoprotein diacylglyceryl transferase [Neomicrococcus aestuarii]|uniref:Phosphatidylglycerol--prolipoprotein diacylglyceryl transferase n=1 Tax=Neomicrococcus aestuarii TaxID=556325 RepID=A0A7W8TVV7_9MICC|nr:prolipoprotein diacylglyceryl transferase [Neomicrococcus aestuarii]